MRGQWLLSGKLRRSIATLDERRLWAVHVDPGQRGFQFHAAVRKAAVSPMVTNAAQRVNDGFLQNW